MVLDSSAVLALLLDEPEAASFRSVIADDEVRLMSAASVVEVGLVIEARKGDGGGLELDLLISKAGIEIVPVDADQAAEARRAWRRFGRGRHAAGLNYGDLFSYALSRTLGEALLYKGEDFSRTDVARVI